MSRFGYRASLLACAALPLATFAAPAAQASAETVLYSFCAQQNCTDGQNPAAGLIEVGGKLYGTTLYGGANGGGTVFTLSPKSGRETVLHAFGSGTDAAWPQASLIDVKGTLYGTSWSGGANSSGAVFSLEAKTGAETVVYSFQNNGSDGANPGASLLDVGGTLYGTTYAGGIDNNGTIFSLDPRTGNETVHSCGNGTYGTQPIAGLIDVNGRLFGTTTNGDTGHEGTVFRFNRKTGIISTLDAFDGTDGNSPHAGLIDVNGVLYGTTIMGGAYNSGAVFSLNPKNGKLSVVYSFQGNSADGAAPEAGLVNVNGTLYGTTNLGGAYGAGTVFSLDLQTGTETVLQSFGSGTDGQYPLAGLTNVNGTLYGTTYLGGAHGNGTVFSITP